MKHCRQTFISLPIAERRKYSRQHRDNVKKGKAVPVLDERKTTKIKYDHEFRGIGKQKSLYWQGPLAI
jgi:hypothetical protein